MKEVFADSSNLSLTEINKQQDQDGKCTIFFVCNFKGKLWFNVRNISVYLINPCDFILAGNQALERDKRVKRAFGLIVPDSYSHNRVDSEKQSILLSSR